MFRSWAEINRSALVFNYRRLRSLNPASCALIAVVKADAYGHGLHAIAQALHRQKVHTFAVASIFEAALLSKILPKANVILLGALLPEEFSDVVGHRRWLPVLSSEIEFRALEKTAKAQRKKTRVHVKLDTGMGRMGGFSKEILRLIQKIKKSKWVTVTGLLSHFSSSDTDLDESLRQMDHLTSFCSVLHDENLLPPLVHFQNSAGSLRIPASSPINGIRPGLALYGVPNPFHAWKKRFGSHPLKPVLSWKTRVSLLRDLPAGSTISYGGTFRTKTKTRTAVLSAGYADGISRKLSNRGEVLIHGKRCKILGRVTMDMIMVDVTRVKNVRWGDTAVLIGKSGKEEITAQDVAQWAETSPYEILCNISKRVPRIIV